MADEQGCYDKDHIRTEGADVTNRTDCPTPPEGTDEDETGEARCTHGLLACRRCGTLPPGVNRFFPPRRGVRAQLHETGRWLAVVPNRADRRAAR